MYMHIHTYIHTYIQALVPIGLMYGANVTASQFIVRNLLPCVAGNIVGGGLIIGGKYKYIHTYIHAY
jgi:formate/nitrite transporter FocA (FNT family)